MDLRKNDTILKFGEENDVPIVLMKKQPLDFQIAQPLPDLRHVISRFYTVKSEGCQDPGWEVAKELWYDWIYINLPPLSVQNIKKRIEKEVKRIHKLRWTHISKRGATWLKEMRHLIIDLDNGLDLRSYHQETIDLLTEEFEIEVGEEEELLYKDNCVPEENGKCLRKRACAGDDMVWVREAQKRREKLEKKDNKLKKRTVKIDKDKDDLKKLKADESVITPDITLEEDTSDEKKVVDEEFKAHPTQEPSKVVQNLSRKSVTTRSKQITSTPEALDQKPVRSSYKNIDNDILEVMVNMESQFGVEQRQVGPLLAYIMNKLAGQKWEPASEETEQLECDDKRNEPKSGKRRKTRDLTFVLPSRRCLNRKLEDAALLNFKFVAESIERTHEVGGTVTSGWDDTVKAAGHRLHDVKSGRVTCVTKDIDTEGKEKKVRQSFTTGFLPNISHSGADSAVAVRSCISQMAVLCNVQFEDMTDFIDFYMNDRAADSDAMLDELGVSEEKRLKCNAHCILCIQNAVDKVFKDKETEIGVNKLISTDAQHVFTSPSNSIFTLGLIAFSKFLSPSHAQLSISLYKPYKQFLTDDSKTDDSETKEISANLLKKGFLGFSSNRFGRTLNLAQTFVDHKLLIQKFYDLQVDHNQNKLFSACYAYLQSDWFHLCCAIGARLNSLSVIPIKLALGIDEYKKSRSEARSWSGMKIFFSDLLNQLSTSALKTTGMSGSQLLEAEVCSKVQSALKNQLDYLKFYREDSEEEPISEETLKKLDEAPLTNSGCESNFAQLDLECKRGSGQTTLQTMSNRHMVKTNQYFNSEDWKNMEPELKTKAWKDARSGDQSKIVKKMQKQFLDKVKASESLANQERIRKKSRKNAKCLELLEVVKKHGGPITPNDLNKLEDLTETEILKEVRYLRQTVAPNIREKRKVDKKFVKFTMEELIQQIKNVLKPQSDEVSSIENLLLNSLKDTSSEDDLEGNIEIGIVGVFEGPLGERKVGVVLTKQTIQFYQPTRYGFQPEDVTEESCDWKISTKIDDFDFISRRTGVYLRCSVKKTDLK